MAKTYHCEIEVRGYELDSFSHVNNAAYFNYLEHARWKLLEEEGITLSKFGEWRQWPIVASVEGNYLKPTLMGEKLDIRTTSIENGRTHFLVEQLIYRGETLVFKGKVRIVMVNDKGRPTEPHPDMRKVYE